MPSNPDSRIEFRDLSSKSTIKALFPESNPHQIAKAIIAHFLGDKANVSLDTCPICNKVFEECDYFRNVEEEA